MIYEDWNHIYEEIASDLGFSKDLDYRSSIVLSSILGESSNLKRIDRFRRKNAYVVGNSPDVREYIEKRPGEVSIVADSAIDTYYEIAGVPDIIVTDLDGNVPLILKCSVNGSLIVLHAHGDNIDLVREWSYMFLGRSIGTTQNAPLWNIFNFYGFTDGDRGAYLADFIGARIIRLVGFDFENPSLKASGDPVRKKKKLKWARVLLTILAHDRGVEMRPGPVIIL